MRAARKTGFERFLELEKDTRFRIDDLSVNGAIKPSENGIDVLVDLDRNPPGTREKLNSLFGANPGSISLSVGLPLLRQRKLVPVGFLTSAYLLWFRSFGYSFVFQDHMEPYREYIRKPEGEVEVPYSALLPTFVDLPQIALVSIDECHVPIAVMGDRAVVFPPRQAPDLLRNLGIGATIDLNKARRIQFDFTDVPDAIYGIAVDQCMVMVPPEFGTVTTEATWLYYIDTEHGGDMPKMLSIARPGATKAAGPNVVRRSLRVPPVGDTKPLSGEQEGT